jgi:hypothetical protein
MDTVVVVAFERRMNWVMSQLEINGGSKKINDVSTKATWISTHDVANKESRGKPTKACAKKRLKQRSSHTTTKRQVFCDCLSLFTNEKQ